MSRPSVMSVPAHPAAQARRPGSLQRRLQALEVAAEAAAGRLDPALLGEVGARIARSRQRLSLSERHTIVAIAGATGSGKSTLFNALAGAEISASGARRPTTSTPQAVTSGSEDLDEMMAWLGVEPADRHHREALGRPGTARLPEGLVLLDLPDIDSTEAAHQHAARRIVEKADLLIWVVDPQKYADAEIHREFLAPLAGHRAVTLVVLNQIDTVPEARRRTMIGDLRKLLIADGIRDPRILTASARHGSGLDELRHAIVRRVDERQNLVLRIEADIQDAATRLGAAAGRAPFAVPDAWVAALERRVEEAAARPAEGRPAAVDRSASDNAIRGFVEDVCRDLGPGWARPVRTAVTRRLGDTDDRLDAELAALPPVHTAQTQAPARRSRAYGVVFLLLVVLSCALRPVLGSVGVRDTALQLLAASAIWAAAAAAALLVRWGGRRAAAARRQEIEESRRRVVARVVREHVLAPVRAELGSYARFMRALRTARS